MGRSTREPRGRNRGGRASTQPDSRLRYGGAWFSAASALPLDLRLTDPRLLARLMAAAVRRPRQLVALIALLVGTPREYVHLSRSCSGRSLDLYFNQRKLGIVKNRLWRGVLLLPQDHAEYLRGRRRHAVRNNLRRAAMTGVRCEVMNDSHRAGDEVSGILRQQWCDLPTAELDAQTNHFRGLVARPETTVMVARDQRGGTLAVLGATIDDSVCAIVFATATCHEARWALHDHLVRTLIDRRVRYLFAKDDGPFGALGYPRSVQHYQHLLGYELRHVTPIPGYRAARRRRRLALVLVTASVALVAAPAAQSTGSWSPLRSLEQIPRVVALLLDPL
jgi:hypothetical protein